MTFETNALDLAPGVVTTILDHPKSELSGGKKLLITAMTFTGSPGGAWRQSCEAVSADAPYYPELTTPKPRVQGIETATVVGPPGEHIHVDEFGRVRVQFHWDLEGSMNDGSSCWIPVSHSWAGGGFGHVNLPRVGHEVIVPDAARMGRWREALKPVTDQYLDELTKKFPGARAAYDKLAATLRQ